MISEGMEAAQNEIHPSDKIMKMRHIYLCLLYPTHFEKGFAVKILGNTGVFSVWIKQCFEHICKAITVWYL